MTISNESQPNRENDDREMRATLLVVRAKLREALALSLRRRR